MAAETYGPEEIEALLGARSIRPRAARKDFVVELAGEIVACGTAVIDGPRSASLEALAVDPRFARRGLATLIVEAVEADLCAAGVEQVRIVATLNALPFCTRVGFRPHSLERIAKHGAALSPIVVHLSKTLLPAPARLRHSRRAAIAAVH
jgi:N-acetylglutamate synthase-like GNAT family acetyltransferase